MDLNNKVIIITGASRGLGAAMARRFAARGCQLALIDLDADSLGDTKTSCEQAGAARVETYAANVAHEQEVVATIDRVAHDFGALHGLVNNAGITRDAMMLKYKDGQLVSKMTLDQWQAVIDVNLTGVFLCGREAAAKMIELGCQGCIVNISSISRHGNMGQANYSASKAGVQALAVVWAKEFARYGIRAASVAPGFVATELVMSMKPEAREKITARVPAGRLGDPDEIAKTVEFIFDNDYVSGRCLDVDGALRL
ncbi:MAG: SDR family oxidoreductase [Gammaproteobacteria bacterium]|jgi:3-oxoacyl-[acyl-carrier protein] reductase|nr:SDR family oxidoreductase [Gammaproteobacteria bacterium]